MTFHAYKTGQIIGASQDGSREFLTLLACICADGTKLPPALIYQGDHADLLDTWVEDFNRGMRHISLQRQMGGVVIVLGYNGCKKYSIHIPKRKLETDDVFLSLYRGILDIRPGGVI